MAANASLREIYARRLNTAVETPEEGDYEALAAIITEMRAAGTPCANLVVDLQPGWPQGDRFLAAYTVARQSLPDLPPVSWQGRKISPFSPQAQQAAEAREHLEKVNAAAAKAGTGNPFADKLAALIR